VQTTIDLSEPATDIKWVSDQKQQIKKAAKLLIKFSKVSLWKKLAAKDKEGG
jgi:hypothetical protein